MERKSKGSRGLEAYCKGGQGPPQALAPPKKKNTRNSIMAFSLLVCMEPGYTFISLIYDIHLKGKLRRDEGSFAIDKIIR